MTPYSLGGHDVLMNALRSHRLLAIIRTATTHSLGPVIETLVDSGVRCLEVTLPTPGSLDAIASARARYGDDIAVGVGTVLSPSDVRRAAEAGSHFVVSPHLHRPTVAEATALGLGALPGVFTPTEALAAMEAGASAAKLFPADVLGPSFVSALRAPLPDIPLVATGGIRLENVRDWLRSGVLAVAVGSPLLGDALLSGDLPALKRRAAAFLAAAGGSGSHA
ncbi:bifunctional 4-hydroxy-2-oxoglutarate aldolase/2-dehydro-3-deoxy-phosphogluconate aldolase [Streptomyces sp. NPDC002262]|uniref:bifunctional 4-hydroxy-2-oxoglutarate aldolase/2-dehydro-3-deoxy-phosphogluconate aldolase n=1 Tax=Streptomyces sp. NPDC002262 TaxID=3154414 RepID=UPI0033273520